MNNILKICIAAQCESAGRENNEDNFLVDCDLSDDVWGFNSEEIIHLGAKGALLVVCDGMGGVNAGEVASATAIETIKERFSSLHLTNEVLKNDNSIKKYIADTIIAADKSIKLKALQSPETLGMGSTCVIAWLIRKKVYVGWCGDSRAYCFNVVDGLRQLSHDHSYVQELVDAGKLSLDLAFDHPNNNIITRSLGDPSSPARPDVADFELREKDIIMLCSDGLSGVLRDEEMAQIMCNNAQSALVCRDALWTTSYQVGWHDNVTIAIAQVVSGGSKAISPKITSKPTKRKYPKWFFPILAIVCVVMGIFLGVFLKKTISPIASPIVIKQNEVIITNDSMENSKKQIGEGMQSEISSSETDSKQMPEILKKSTNVSPTHTESKLDEKNSVIRATTQNLDKSLQHVDTGKVSQGDKIPTKNKTITSNN